MKTKKQASLHDRFFKRFYSDPEFAVELFKLALSEQEFSDCDWSTLKAEKDSLKDKRADLVFTVSFKEDRSSKILLCLLLEHKSFYDKKVFRQILIYQALLYDRKLEKTAMVIPILFYHGKTPWKWPISFQKGFFSKHLQKTSPAWRKNMVDFEPRIVDTNDPKVREAFKDLRIKSRGILAVLGKIWFIKNSPSELLALVEAFSGFSGKREDLLLAVVNYLKTAGGVSTKLWEKVEKTAVERGLLTRGGYMDIREEIKEEGIQEGLQAGMQKGRQEGLQAGIQKGLQAGMQKGRQEGLQAGMQKGLQAGMQKGLQTGMQQVALNMLKNNFALSVISEMTGLSAQEIKKLKNGSI